MHFICFLFFLTNFTGFNLVFGKFKFFIVCSGINSEFSRTPSSWSGSSSQKTARVNFITGSTEPGSVAYNTLESTSSNSVSIQSPEFPPDESPPLTVIEIENPFGEHVYIGTKGPNQRESDAITRALDWLAEKRTSDYGWGNDTHMVILAKEVCLSCSWTMHLIQCNTKIAYLIKML